MIAQVRAWFSMPVEGRLAVKKLLFWFHKSHVMWEKYCTLPVCNWWFHVVFCYFLPAFHEKAASLCIIKTWVCELCWFCCLVLIAVCLISFDQRFRIRLFQQSESPSTFGIRSDGLDCVWSESVYHWKIDTWNPVTQLSQLFLHTSLYFIVLWNKIKNSMAYVKTRIRSWTQKAQTMYLILWSENCSRIWALEI